MSVIDKIKNTLIEINQEKYCNIGKYDYLNLDSLTSVKLIVCLENSYDIEISDNLLTNLADKNMLEFSAIIEKMIAEKNTV